MQAEIREDTTIKSESKPPVFPDNAQFWYEARRAFGAASYGASEFGEVLVTARRIKSGDYDSWYEEWNRMAEKVAHEAGRKQFLRRKCCHSYSKLLAKF